MSSPSAIQISGSNGITNDQGTAPSWQATRLDPTGHTVIVGLFQSQELALEAAVYADNQAQHWNG